MDVVECRNSGPLPHPLWANAEWFNSDVVQLVPYQGDINAFVGELQKVINKVVKTRDEVRAALDDPAKHKELRKQKGLREPREVREQEKPKQFQAASERVTQDVIARGEDQPTVVVGDAPSAIVRFTIVAAIIATVFVAGLAFMMKAVTPTDKLETGNPEPIKANSKPLPAPDTLSAPTDAALSPSAPSIPNRPLDERRPEVATSAKKLESDSSALAMSIKTIEEERNQERKRTADAEELQKRRDEASTEAKELQKRRDEATTTAILEEGENCFAAKKYDCTISSANAVLRLSPQDLIAEALRERAIAAQKKALESVTIQ